MSKIFKTFKNVWHVIKEVLRFHWMLQSRRRWKCFYRCRIKYNPCCQTADFYSKASHLMREVWLRAEMHLICKVHEKGLGRPCLKHQPLLSLYQLSFYQPCLRGDSLLEQSWFWGARREEAGAWYSWEGAQDKHFTPCPRTPNIWGNSDYLFVSVLFFKEG